MVQNNEIGQEKFKAYLLIRRNNRLKQISALLFGLGSLFIIIYGIINNRGYETIETLFAITGMFFILFGIGIILYIYLQSGNISFSSALIKDNNDAYIEKEISKIKFELLKLEKYSSIINKSDDERKDISRIANAALTEDLIADHISKDFNERILRDNNIENINTDLNNISQHIKVELARIRRSANLNLVIGTLSTLLAMAALTYEVITKNIEFTETVKFLSHYLPRLSIIIFIEIFAFFFLKLYKTNLDDIKFFNNEQTNIDFKIISLKTALYKDDSNLLNISINELVKTERNFKLQKGESTAELEKIKNNNNNISKLFEKVIEKI